MPGWEPRVIKAMPWREFLRPFGAIFAIEYHQSFVGVWRWLEVIGLTEGIPNQFDLTLIQKNLTAGVPWLTAVPCRSTIVNATVETNSNALYAARMSRGCGNRDGHSQAEIRPAV